jgi:hypothetical protein
MGKRLNLEGQRFGWLTAVEPANATGLSRWLCVCDCGGRKVVASNHLTRNLVRSCGCAMKHRRAVIRNLNGQKFRDLTAIGMAPSSPTTNDRSSRWLCRCTCGGLEVISARALRKGNRVQCRGCGRQDRGGKSRSREGKSFYQIVRERAKALRVPPWAELNKIAEFYLNRPSGMAVDHVIPLQGKLVSGLHVLDNLQYITRRENSSKNNKFTPQFITADLC